MWIIFDSGLLFIGINIEMRKWISIKSEMFGQGFIVLLPQAHISGMWRVLSQLLFLSRAVINDKKISTATVSAIACLSTVVVFLPKSYSFFFEAILRELKLLLKLILE